MGGAAPPPFRGRPSATRTRLRWRSGSAPGEGCPAAPRPGPGRGGAAAMVLRLPPLRPGGRRAAGGGRSRSRSARASGRDAALACARLPRPRRGAWALGRGCAPASAQILGPRGPGGPPASAAQARGAGPLQLVPPYPRGLAARRPPLLPPAAAPRPPRRPLGRRVSRPPPPPCAQRRGLGSRTCLGLGLAEAPPSRARGRGRCLPLSSRSLPLHLLLPVLVLPLLHLRAPGLGACVSPHLGPRMLQRLAGPPCCAVPPVRLSQVKSRWQPCTERARRQHL